MSKTVRKSANIVDTEELLRILEESVDQQTEEDHTDKYKNDVLQFLSYFKIEPGQDLIKQHTLFAIYRVWSLEPIQRKNFILEVNKFLEFKGGVYYINQNAVKLTKHVYNAFTKQNSRLKSKSWNKHYQNFLDYHSIKQGEWWVTKDDFYLLYWTYIHSQNLTGGGKHLSKQYFARFSEVFFKYKITKHGKVYAVSDNIRNFFREGQLEQMKEEYAKTKKAEDESQEPTKTS